MRSAILSLALLVASVAAGPIKARDPRSGRQHFGGPDNVDADTVPPNTDAGAVAMVLDAHNAARASCGVDPLTWSDSIASQAQAYANRCLINPLVHSHTQGVGENLAANTNANLSNMVTGQWVDEDKDYDFSLPTGFSEATGHFTQCVWKGTTQVGCGWTNCNGELLLVCQYDPPGNVVGDNNKYFRDNVFPRENKRPAPPSSNSGSSNLNTGGSGTGNTSGNSGSSGSSGDSGNSGNSGHNHGGSSGNQSGNQGSGNQSGSNGNDFGSGFTPIQGPSGSGSQSGNNNGGSGSGNSGSSGNRGSGGQSGQSGQNNGNQGSGNNGNTQEPCHEGQANANTAHTHRWHSHHRGQSGQNTQTQTTSNGKKTTYTYYYSW